VLDDQQMLWVVDACNHRLQVFDLQPQQPKLVDVWGQAGDQPGQLRTPYGMVFDTDGTLLVCEYGNHRIQRFTRQGQSLEIIGGHGKQPGQLLHPWGIALDNQRRLHVLDSENHRVQRFKLS
jgi:sugar lactone lactonase YvrE